MFFFYRVIISSYAVSTYLSTHLNYLIFLSDFNLHNGWCITLRKYVLQEFAILANFFYCLSLTSCSLGKLPLCSGVTVYLMYSYEQKFVIAENIWSESLAKNNVKKNLRNKLIICMAVVLRCYNFTWILKNNFIVYSFVCIN
jgi:hypothetical protein